MELYNMTVDVFQTLLSNEMMETLLWILFVQLAFAVAVIWSAIRLFRKSADESEFSSAFYIQKKHYGLSVMDDRPYDYLKH
ncbi:hypothetical protein [Maridesulfovibrio sp.]|uniref:hypothetical protein n=1 Tax=unclassified Maridesulfovibrio TaxID=2794999 RepID=UPI003AFF7AA4